MYEYNARFNSVGVQIMGKYPNSELHNKYSDWHWKLTEKDEKYKRLYVADIDRLWIEYDFDSEEIVGVIDIKWDDSIDTLTPTENGIYNWFRRHGVRVYTVYINKNFTKFRVVNNKGKEIVFSEYEYANWLLSWRTAAKNKIHA